MEDNRKVLLICATEDCSMRKEECGCLKKVNKRWEEEDALLLTEKRVVYMLYQQGWNVSDW